MDKTKSRHKKKATAVQHEENVKNLVDAEKYQHEPLVQLLFGRRFHGATWLHEIQGPESLELRVHIANLSKNFPVSITGLCFVVYADFCRLIRDARILKILAEKMVWDCLPVQTDNLEREHLLSRYNIEPNCKSICRDALEGAKHSVAEVARDGWARLETLSQQLLDLHAKLQANDARMALGIMAEIDSFLSDVKGWPTCVTRITDWLQRLMSDFSASQGTNTTNTTLELLVQGFVQVKGAVEKNTQETKETKTAAEQSAADARMAARAATRAETAAKNNKREKALDADLVDTFKDMDNARKDPKNNGLPHVQVAEKVMDDAKKAGRLIGNMSAASFVNAWRQWCKWHRPEAETYTVKKRPRYKG